jgi:transposase
MKQPIFVRPLSDAERETLEAGLRSSDAFTLRRCQIANQLGSNPQTARNAIHAFNEKGLPQALRQGSKRPHTVHRAFQGPEQAEALRELLHHKPTKFGKDTRSLWRLDLAAEVSLEESLTEERITKETVRATLARMGVRWEQAKRWITSPDPEYARKKASFASDRLMGLAESRPEWAVGFLDETCFSRLARPALHSFSEAGEPLRLIEQSVAKDDPDPKAISCYGPYVPELEKVWVRLVDGRPVSSISTRFLSWCCQKLQAAGKKVWVLIWDNASWHISKEVRGWIASHNRGVKNGGQGVRIISCLLPKKSPWLNSMEPKWVLMPSARW